MSSIFPKRIRFRAVSNRLYVERMRNWICIGSVFSNVFHVIFLGTTLSLHQSSLRALFLRFRNSLDSIFLFSLQSHDLCTLCSRYLFVLNEILSHLPIIVLTIFFKYGDTFSFTHAFISTRQFQLGFQ